MIENALEEAQLSLAVNAPLVQTIHDLKAINPDLEFYVMSNISRVSLLAHVYRFSHIEE